MKQRNYALWIVGICVLVFGLQTLFPSISDQFALYSSRVLTEPWLLITSVFLHGSFEHLFFNMFALALFGFILERIIGSKRFILVFLISGILSGIGSAAFYPASLGASGAIFGIMGALTVLRPKMYVWVMGVPMPMFIAAILWAAIDLVGMFAPTGIANAAHLVGLGSGLVIGLYLRRNFKKENQKEKEKLSEEEKRRVDSYLENWEV